MKEKIPKDEALKIALRHLVADAQKRYEHGVKVHDGVPDGLPLYMRANKDREHCWCISIPRTEEQMPGKSRYICISKDTGEVLFDGWAGE